MYVCRDNTNWYSYQIPELSNNPIKIHVFNWDLIWNLHHSFDYQIIEMIPEIKFAYYIELINLLVRRTVELFDCNSLCMT